MNRRPSSLASSRSSTGTVLVGSFVPRVPRRSGLARRAGVHRDSLLSVLVSCALDRYGERRRACCLCRGGPVMGPGAGGLVWPTDPRPRLHSEWLAAPAHVARSGAMTLPRGFLHLPSPSSL